METTFVSELYPEMNDFLMRLEVVLQELPDNPKPECKGFYIAFWRPGKETTVEKIGIIPKEKEAKYSNFALKKCTQTLERKVVRSKDFADDTLEQYPGGVRLSNGCVGTSGHEGMVDEAISGLWLLYKNALDTLTTKMSWSHFLRVAMFAELSMLPGNKWITIIAGLMAGVEIQTIEINGKKLLYTGEPLQAYAFDSTGWGGRSNFAAANSAPKLQLKDLDDCLKWLKCWKTEGDYERGYILDFKKQTIYYDSEEALQHLKEKTLPARGLDNYFIHFTKQDF